MKKLKLILCSLSAVVILCLFVLTVSCDATSSDDIEGQWYLKDVTRSLPAEIFLSFNEEGGCSWEVFEGELLLDEESFTGTWSLNDELDLNQDEADDLVVQISYGEAENVSSFNSIYFIENKGFNLKLITWKVSEEGVETNKTYYFERGILK